MSSKNLQVRQLLFDFNKTLNDFVVNKAHAISSLEVTPVTFCVSLAIGKAIKTHKAIIILCTNGYGEDASILSRSLFEMLLDILYISKVDNFSRAIRYIEHSWIIKKKYLETLNKNSHHIGFNEVEVDDEMRKKIVSEAERVQKEHSYKGDGWSDKNRWEMAKDVGVEVDYEIAYKMMSSFVHTDILGLDSYASLDAAGDPVINLYPSDKYIDVTLVTAFEYLMKIVDKWNELLKLNLDSELETFAKNYSAAIKSANVQ